ncbi:hypothetical protein GGR51DRAFT_531635 [Nemania sp. FL0031]|nr:hypothetical protein GGR51DRAFT_531635 [Nemania sp. FL0031]
MLAKSPPPRPPAIKRTLSNKSELHVKFAEPTIWSFSGPLSPRLPLTERSSPRPEYRAALRRTISSTSVSSSLLKHEVNEVEEEDEGDTEVPLEVATEIRINEPDGISTAGDGCTSHGSTGSVGQAESYVTSEHDAPALGNSRTVGERSSARVPSPNVQDIEVLRNIMDTLRKHKIPGPQLFRVQTEFPRVLGFGGEGNVHGTDESIDNKINDLKLNNADKPKWRRFAIKRHGPRHGPRDEDQVFELKNYLAAAEAEISALSHLLRGHRNIVQLRGWGLCLDTLENTQNITEPPTELSSFNLHLPLIILERADGDLRQFLKHVFSDNIGTDTTGCSPESIAEAGHGQLPGNTTDGPPNAYPFPPRPEQVSLSGSTLHDDDDDTTFRKYTTTVPELEESNHASEFWIINGMNRHEVLRRLCVDIGHGLQALHEMNMTHGDLKPRNVLVFREGPVWTAKLCDFGLSNDFDNSSPLDSSEHGAHYVGTFDWRPHWFGHRTKKHSIRALQEFDLTVYGVLVWSAFSPLLRGKAPPISEEYHQSNPRELFSEHLEEIAPKGCGQSMLGSKAALARRVNRLVQGTVCASYHQHKGSYGGQDNWNWRLDERPWEQLYSHTVRATRSLWSRIPSSEQDASYSEHGKHRAMEPSIETTSSSTIEARPCSRPKATARLCDPRRYQESQTSSLLTAENLCLPNCHEIGESYKVMGNNSDDLTLLHDNLHNLVRDVSEDPKKHALSLYSEARRRATRTTLNTWKSIPNRQNIVGLALVCMPPLDIHTMAWLCRGEVGIEEVRSLPAEYSIWKVILEPGALNESERLELFLLLVHFGARIERTLSGHPTLKSRSILSSYLLSCRLATRTVVANEICRHYGRILSSHVSKPHEPDATRYYMTASRRHRPRRMNDDCETVDKSTALGNIKLDKKEHKGVYPFLKLNFEQLLDEHNDIYYQTRRRPPSHATDETTPLRNTKRPEVGSATTYNTVSVACCNSPSSETTRENGLPPPTLKPSLPGWSECGNAFINELTRSITLKRPTVTLAQLRHISIGHVGSNNVLEIDMADFMLPMDSSSPSSLESEENPYALRQRIKKRFPFFDEAWISSDIRLGDAEEDVLAALKNDSRWEQELTAALSSQFEIKPPDFSVEAFLSRNFSTLLFFIQYPTAALGLLWELVVWLHDQAGAPIAVSYIALRRELKSLDTTRRPFLNLLRWVPMVFGRTIVLLLAGTVCLLGASLAVAVVLGLMLG